MRGSQLRVKEASHGALNALEETKLRLLAERRHVAGAIAANPLSACNSEDQEPDYDSTEQIRDLEYSHREALSRRLKQLDAALDRITEGTYGHCADCGAQIADKRLASDPALTVCVACQAASETAHPSATL